MVAIRWRSHGTHTGSFMGVPSTERTVEVVGASFCRFSDGLLAEEWVVWDPRELLTAMSIWKVGSDE
jgi:predicted ester cyclase